MSKRTLTITSCTPFKSGVTRGREWTIHKIEAVNGSGPVDEDLISFDKLPISKEQEFEVEKREREFKGKLYTSFTVSLPKEHVELPGPEVVPAGRYAVDTEDGELAFYRVWRGTRRPEYVKLYLLHGPESTELPFPAIRPIMTKIAQDPKAAAIRYGHEIGSCCVCNLRLTNRISRELGIGPICGGRFYSEQDDWSKVKADAREAIMARGDDPDEVVEEVEVVE